MEQKETLTQPLIFIGCSGAGKSTMINKLFEDYENQFKFSISSTTRPQRGQEINGVHYYFLTKELFQKQIEEDYFIEYCWVHENLYGTSKIQVEEVMKQKKICILDIDVEGAKKVYKHFPNATYIYIKVPSIEELEKRLRSRQTDTEEQIQIRLKNAKIEIEEINKLSYFQNFINDDKDQCYKELVEFLKKKYESEAYLKF